MSEPGSTPGKSTKKSGVGADESANVSFIVEGLLVDEARAELALHPQRQGRRHAVGAHDAEEQQALEGGELPSQSPGSEPSSSGDCMSIHSFHSSKSRLEVLDDPLARLDDDAERVHRRPLRLAEEGGHLVRHRRHAALGRHREQEGDLGVGELAVLAQHLDRQLRREDELVAVEEPAARVVEDLEGDRLEEGVQTLLELLGRSAGGDHLLEVDLREEPAGERRR